MWFPFALAFAVLSSITVVIAKRVMRETGEYLYLWASTLFNLPFLFLIILYFYQIPQIDQTFLAVIVVGTAISVIAAVSAYRAIKITDVSLVAPIAAFNPVFTAIISFFALGELINMRGVAGIILVCVGAYLLGISQVTRDWLAPLKRLWTNTGVRLSFLAYFLWAITPTFQKTAILHTSPQVPPFAAFAGGVADLIILSPLVLKFAQNPVYLVRHNLGLLFLAGILGALGAVAAFTAFSLGPLGLVTAIFKLSLIFTVILGWLVFKEKDIQDRILGSLVMLAGVLLLVM